MPISYLLTNT